MKEICLTYKYRIHMSKCLIRHLEKAMRHTADLYNAALQERIEAYAYKQKYGKGKVPSNFDQNKSLTIYRNDPTYDENYAATMQRWPLKKVDEAFKAFFKRAKKGQAGFPRYKSAKRMNSFGFTDKSGWKVKGNILKIKGIGRIKIRDHRDMPTTKPVALSITRNGKKWAVNLVYKIPITKSNKNNMVGLDMGVTNLATLSDGTIIDNSNISTRYSKKIKQRQRELSRCVRGSKNRMKAKQRLAKIKNKERNARDTYLHQVSSELSNKYHTICLEKLSVKKMVENKGNYKKSLNHSLHDVALSKLKMLLMYKLCKKGGKYIEVDAAYTSQQCHSCGHIDKKNRTTQAEFLCVSCGHADNADINAAKNIYDKGVGFLEKASDANSEISVYSN